jgi:hypothetical protein
MNAVHGNVHANFETNTWLKPEDWDENNPESPKPTIKRHIYAYIPTMDAYRYALISFSTHPPYKIKSFSTHPLTQKDKMNINILSFCFYT